MMTSQAYLRWRRLKMRPLLGVALLLSGGFLAIPSMGRAAHFGQTGFNHHDGTQYCVQAYNVTLTTRQIQTFQQQGTLFQEIVERSQATIRVLPDLQLYTEGFGCADLHSLRLASEVIGTQTFHVTLQVDADRDEFGAVVIVVQVVQTTSAVINDAAGGVRLYRLYAQPQIKPMPPPEDTSQPISTEVAPPSAPNPPTASPPPSASPAQSVVDSAASEPRDNLKVTDEADASEDAQDDAATWQAEHDPGPDTTATPIQQTSQRWIAVLLYLVTAFLFVPILMGGIVTDLGLLRWYYRRLNTARMENTHVGS